MRSAFGAVCKSSFRYFKAHKLLHTPIQITMFGNLDVPDANRWEHFHIVAAKQMYGMIARRTSTLAIDMEKALFKMEKYNFIFEYYEVESFLNPRSPDAGTVYRYDI